MQSSYSNVEDSGKPHRATQKGNAMGLAWITTELEAFSGTLILADATPLTGMLWLSISLSESVAQRASELDSRVSAI